MIRTQTHAEPSFGQLLKELSLESRDLVQQEIALAKAEMSEKASRVGRNIAYLAVGGLIAYAGFMVLLLAASWGLREALNETMPDNIAMWLAPLIVGFVVAIVGYILVQKGITTLKNTSLAPRQTIQSIRENKQWLQDRMT